MLTTSAAPQSGVPCSVRAAQCDIVSSIWIKNVTLITVDEHRGPSTGVTSTESPVSWSSQPRTGHCTKHEQYNYIHGLYKNFTDRMKSTKVQTLCELCMRDTAN